MNEGKKFEQDWKASIPDNVFYLRLKDAGGWSNAENTRFTPSNPCDSIMFAGGILWMLELKSHKGKSLPLNCVRENQVNELMEAYSKGVKAYLIINFRDVETTYALSIYRFKHYFQLNPEKKSIPLSHIREFGVKIPQEKKRTRYRYDVESMLREVG